MVEGTVQRGVIATLEALIQPHSGARRVAEVWNILLGKRTAVWGRNSYILDDGCVGGR